MEYKLAKIDQDTLVNFLSEIELFNELNRHALKDLANSLTPISVQGGETLIEQGANDSNMYILFLGRLRVSTTVREQSKVKELILAEISSGQIVGEIALLTKLPRTTTVRVVRDSILLQIDEAAFLPFQKQHPQGVIEIAKTALKRLAIKPRPTQIGENFITLTVAPAGYSDHRPFIHQLHNEINKLKPTCLITSKFCDEHFGRSISQANFEDPDSILITSWLESMEKKYEYVIYETDNTLTAWTKRCLRQADRMIFVAEYESSRAINDIENSIYSDAKKIKPYIEIVFVHPIEQIEFEGTEHWLRDRIFNAYNHIKLNSKDHFDRYIRILTGQALGVTLNGGGARGIVHVGVLKALEELKIPIDFIGGTSMGGGVGGGYALYGLSSLIKCIENFGKNFRTEWTLPLIALSKGRFYSNHFYNEAKDTRIEDLWIRFFCVSANLTEEKVHIHDRGSMWIALRATASVPAVFPPIYTDEGDMLVDGGAINNMPVDIMRKMMCGGKILAVNCHKRVPSIKKKKIKHTWISGWKVFFQKYSPFHREKVDYDYILNILYESMELSFTFKQKKMEQEADFYLEVDTSNYSPSDFHRYKELIDIGYRTAMEKLPDLLQDRINKTSTLKDRKSQIDE